VEEHLILTYRIRKGVIDPVAEEAESERILREVMLTAHRKKLVKECSGGMKRKLSLAMALMGETKTIILDEPTSGLDVESRRQVWNLIKTIRQGRSIIMST
jgi:ABC-type multidrug transport system ATPase subunit